MAIYRVWPEVLEDREYRYYDECCGQVETGGWLWMDCDQTEAEDATSLVLSEGDLTEGFHWYKSVATGAYEVWIADRELEEITNGDLPSAA